MINNAVGEICKSAFWTRIDGWEVVVAVMLIVTAWATVQVARLYYTAVIARIGTCHAQIKDD